MDFSFFADVLKMIIILPSVLLLIYFTFKYGGKYLENINNGRIIRVYERVPLGQNVFLLVVSISGKVYLVSNGEKGAEILLELDENVLDVYNKSKAQQNEIINSYISKLNLNSIKGKIKDEKMQ